MTTQGQFILMTPAEFREWLKNTTLYRTIRVIQQHHTYEPSYNDFDGSNHFKLLVGMRNYHMKKHKWSDIGQNLTTFPDGTVAVCRPLDDMPAGVRGCNAFGICIENLGNFDRGGDTMTDQHRECILNVTAALLERFGLVASIDTITYHSFWDLNTGKCTNMNGTGKGSFKSCPGNFGFFGGNTADAMQLNFIPLL